MKRTGWMSILIAVILMFQIPLAQTATAKFNIVPVNNSHTSILLPSNFTETVEYLVTNQTRIARTLTMHNITGVNQTTTGSDVCPNPFTLSPGQSCILTLVVDGSQIPATGIKGGPVICKTQSGSNTNPDPFLCSQPENENILNVSPTTKGEFAYIANQFGDSVSICQANPASGFLTNCRIAATGFGNPEAIGITPNGSFFYVANLTTNSITVCARNTSTGALSNCVDSGGVGFTEPDGIAFNADGSILYASNINGASGCVSACDINPNTGALSNCNNNSRPEFAVLSDMALNPEGTIAYVPSRDSSKVSVCTVNGQVVDSCTNASGSNISGPEGVTISPAGRHAYIANAASANITLCDINSDTGLLENCTITNGEFRGTGNIGINNTGSFAYVPNQDLNKVFLCKVNNVIGGLFECLPSLAKGLTGPAGIVLK